MSNFLDSLDHITVLTENLELTKNFYIKILGMEIDNNRPPFKFEGVWLSLNRRAVVHIVVRSIHKVNEDSVPTLDHIAFKAKNIINVKKHLKKNAIPYEEKITPDNKISQLFIKDPNGIKIELSKPL
jgi:catechol 2,3-dioxygenase-like lactoylglutathione lyase family enzyme